MKSFNKFVNDKNLPSQIKSTSGSEGLLKEMLAILRAQYWNYQTSHWQSNGLNYYGNHLLFQRLYEGVQGEIDTIAEKIVGYFKKESVDGLDSMKKTQEWLTRWNKTSDLIDRGIESEQDFQASIKRVYDTIKNNDDMHLGLDDFLMAISSSHDTNLYLLQQIKR